MRHQVWPCYDGRVLTTKELGVKRLVVAVLGAACIFSAGPASADLTPLTKTIIFPQPTAPVQIGRCWGYSDDWFPGSSTALSFKNTTNVVATSVTFQFESLGRDRLPIGKVLMTRTGTFSPGVPIEPTFGVGSSPNPQFKGLAGVTSEEAITCAVASVSFADGTVWNESQKVLTPWRPLNDIFWDSDRPGLRDSF